jgi:HlyD family secretion protein
MRSTGLPLRYWVSPAIAALLLAFAVWSVFRVEPPARAEPPAEPATRVFPYQIAGSGIVEPNSETIAVATELGGVVKRISVRPGEDVGVGAPLFAIDDVGYRAARDAAQAAVSVKTAALAGTESQIERQAFVVASAAASVEAAQADLDRAALDRARYERLSATTVASQQRLENAVAEERRAAAALSGARSTLLAARLQTNVLNAARLEAQAALAEAQAKLAEAQAKLAHAEIDLDRTVVHAPIAGRILKIAIHLGEYAQPGTTATPLMLMGAVVPLHVRVDIDETDLARFEPGARAVAQLRGSVAGRADLSFVRLEPRLTGKRELNSEPSQRVDMRVAQAIYRLDPAALVAYPGQQLDVFIEVPREHALAARP